MSGRPAGPAGQPTIPGYITEQEQAQRSGVSSWTLRAWRAKGYGPRHTKFGRCVLYAEDANERFLEEQAAAAKEPRHRGRPRKQAASLPSDRGPPLAAASNE